MLCGEKKKIYSGKTPEQKIKGNEVLPPWSRARIMVPQSFSDLQITEWGRSGERGKYFFRRGAKPLLNSQFNVNPTLQK